MPNLTIPDYLLTRKYDPENDSPNSDVFSQNNQARQPIPVLGLDNTLSWCSDVFQDFKTQIDAIVVDQIGVNGTAGQLLAFVNDDVLGAVNLQDALTALGAPIIDGSNIILNTIYGNSIRNASITPIKLIDGCATTPKIADGAITPPKIPANSIPFTKFVVPQNAAVIGGTTTNGGSWYEVAVGNYQIATKKPQNNGVTAVSLVEVWSGTVGTFDGAKITPESIDGSIAMQSNSTPLGTMKSAGTTTSVVCGRTTDQKFVEVTLGNLQVITKTTNATSPSAQNLSTVFNNEAGTPYDGSQLQNNSTPITKLQNAGQVAPFSMGYVLGNGTIQKSLNIASVTRTGAGYYEVRFNTQANDSNYIVVFGTQDSGTPGFIVANIAQNTRTVNGFDVETGSGAALINGEFNFVVYAF